MNVWWPSWFSKISGSVLIESGSLNTTSESRGIDFFKKKTKSQLTNQTDQSKHKTYMFSLKSELCGLLKQTKK